MVRARLPALASSAVAGLVRVLVLRWRRARAVESPRLRRPGAALESRSTRASDALKATGAAARFFSALFPTRPREKDEEPSRGSFTGGRERREGGGAARRPDALTGCNARTSTNVHTPPMGWGGANSTEAGRRESPNARPGRPAVGAGRPVPRHRPPARARGHIRGSGPGALRQTVRGRADPRASRLRAQRLCATRTVPVRSRSARRRTAPRESGARQARGARARARGRLGQEGGGESGPRPRGREG